MIEKKLIVKRLGKDYENEMEQNGNALKIVRSKLMYSWRPLNDISVASRARKSGLSFWSQGPGLRSVNWFSKSPRCVLLRGKWKNERDKRERERDRASREIKIDKTVHNGQHRALRCNPSLLPASSSRSPAPMAMKQPHIPRSPDTITPITTLSRATPLVIATAIMTR